jgi:Flp pilus assembly protein TadG
MTGHRPRRSLPRPLCADRARDRGRPQDRDAGTISLYMALFVVALLAMAGLVLDGGAAIAARGRAADLAEQAARAGADALSPSSLRGPTPNALAIDPVAARTAANRVLTLGGATGEVRVSGLDVTVTAHVERHAVILSALGVNDLTGTATSTATVVYGTTTGRN